MMQKEDHLVNSNSKTMTSIIIIIHKNQLEQARLIALVIVIVSKRRRIRSDIGASRLRKYSRSASILIAYACLVMGTQP